MNDVVFELIGKLLAAFVVGLLAYLAPRISDWLTAHTDKATEEAIMLAARAFAQAAEHLLKAEDPTGEKRREYVFENLEALGITVTDSVAAMLEGIVWEINLNNSEGNENEVD